MDFKAFSESEFEPVDWINDAFSSLSDTSQIEPFSSELVYKLQLFIQEINKSLEESAQNVILNLSKMQREVQEIVHKAQDVQEDLEYVQKIVKKSICTEETDQLMEINTIKMRILNACDRLKEADSWKSLSIDLEKVFANGSTEDIFDKLLCMQNSLDILSNIPDFSQRNSKLNEMKSRFETLIVPQLTILYFSNSPEQLSDHIRMLQRLRCHETVVTTFRQAVTQKLQLEWNTLCESEESPVERLSSVCEFLLQTTVQQLPSTLTFISSDPVEATICLLRVLANAFDSIESKISTQLLTELEQRELAHQTDASCLILQACRQVLDKFLRNLSTLILNPSRNLDSKKIYTVAQSFTRSIVMPYRKIVQINLTCTQRAYLQDQLGKITQEFQLTEFVSKVFSAVREVERRAHSLVSLLTLPSFVLIVEEFLTGALDHLSTCLERIKHSIVSQNTFVANWQLFQLALLYTQTSGDFSLQIKCYQEHIIEMISKVDKIINQEIDDIFAYDLALLETLQIDDLKELVQKSKNEKQETLVLLANKCSCICVESANSVFSVALTYVNAYLMKAEFNTDSSLRDNDKEVPLFSFSPQEYITQIGQYLLTIPQHIEPFTLHDNPGLQNALAHFTKTLNIPLENVAECFLRILMDQITKAIVTRFRNLNLNSEREKMQLNTDIEYLCEIISDLGIQVDKNLVQLIQELKPDHN